jgi:hypothetical protein
LLINRLGRRNLACIEFDDLLWDKENGTRTTHLPRRLSPVYFGFNEYLSRRVHRINRNHHIYCNLRIDTHIPNSTPEDQE